MKERQSKKPATSAITKATRIQSYRQTEKQSMRQLVLDALGFNKLTAREIAERMHKSGALPYPARSLIQPRITELVKDGIIEAVGIKRDEETKRKVAVYRVACNMDCFNCVHSDCIRDERQDDRERRMRYYYAHKKEESERRKAYYSRNAEKEKEYAREYRRKHMLDDPAYRQKNKKRCKAYADSHREEKRATDRAYYQKNREKLLEYQRQYRERKKAEREVQQCKA